MLPRSSKTNYQSTLSAVEGISLFQENSSKLESSSFPSIEKEDSDKEGKDNSTSQNTDTCSTSGNPDVGDLFSQSNFQEIFDRFFIAEHEQLLSIRIKMRRERGIDENSLLITLSEMNGQEMQALREHYYQLQMVFFRTPKGGKYETLL